MDELDSHLKLFPPSMLTIYKLFEHIGMLSIGIRLQPYTVILTLLGSDFRVCGNLWSQNDVIWSWLRLTATSNCFPYPSYTNTKCLSTLIWCLWAYGSSLTQLYPPTWIKFWGSESLVESKCCQYVLTETDSHLKLLPSYILDVYIVFEHIDMLSMGIQ